MKNLVMSCLLLSCIGLQSCKKNEDQKVVEAAKAEAEKVVSTQCYKAIFEKDTLDLKLNTLKNGKISGNLVMKVSTSEKVGEVTGEFHGDTLFVDYTFKDKANNNNATFKNPMALLKRDKQLILGSGTMQTTMGVTYLVKDKPIDFEKVKYKFDTVDCVEGKK